MKNTGGILGQIGESFEQIGTDVVKQTVQVPKDIAESAAESLGLSGSKKNPPQQKPKTPEEQKMQEEKQVVARAALEELIGKKPKEKELSVWEKIQKEQEEKKALEKKKKEEAAKQTLPNTGKKRPRGDLYGIKAKKAAAEMSRNVRQD